MLTERPRRAAATAGDNDGPVRGALPRFGVALFDESKDSGWACLPVGEPFRFRQPQDLPSDCIWVCSSTVKDHRERFGNTSHLRNSEYVSKLTALAADFGLRIDGEGKWGILAQRASSMLAPAVHRAMVIASQVYGWAEPTRMLRLESLSEDIRAHLVQLIEPPQPPNYLRAPFASALQTYSSCNWNQYMPDSLTVTLRFNRVEYAKRIMATEVPDGSWSFMGSENDPGFQYSMEMALDPEVPCLVNATVEFGGRDQDIATLCAFGSTPNKGAPLRTWVSQPELRWLSQHAHVQINAVQKSSGSKPLPQKIQLPELLTCDELFSLSVSAGLVAEAHWRALAKDVYKPTRDGKKDISAWAVWLRAADRAFCFELALAAHKEGFQVQGYGNGSVVVRVPRATLPKLLDFCMENNVAHPAFRSLFEEHGFIDKES